MLKHIRFMHTNDRTSISIDNTHWNPIYFEMGNIIEVVQEKIAQYFDDDLDKMNEVVEVYEVDGFTHFNFNDARIEQTAQQFTVVKNLGDSGKFLIVSFVEIVDQVSLMVKVH